MAIIEVRPPRWISVIALVAAGCHRVPPDQDGLLEPCATATRTLAPDAVSAMGFSADDAVAWFGDEVFVDVEWGGRHSDNPPSDTIVILPGEILGDVVETTNTAARPIDDPAWCADQNRLSFERQATFATADGGVSGAGTVHFRLAELGFDEADISGSAAEVTLSDARRATVDAEIAEAGAQPAESMALSVGHARTFDYATIAANGPNYVLKIWNCDEQRSPGCAAWR